MKVSLPTPILRIIVLVVLSAVFFLTLVAQWTALAAPSDIEVTIFTAPNLVVDSNVLSPSTQAPEVATVIGRFCNTSGSTLNNVIGYVGDYNSATPGNSTPGTYPSKTNVTIGGQFYSGTYSFTHLGGAVDAVRIIGSLASGACSYQYWSFSYPKTANGGTIPTWGSSVQPIDDLFLDFDIWAAEGSTICNTGACNKTHTATMRNEISAMANKVEPNGNPGGQWFNTNTQTVNVGEPITTNGILYRLGNINKGFDNNGDLVPDYNAWLQPIGNPTYDPTCFRLIEASGVLTVTRSGGNPDMIIPFNHSLNQQNDAPLLYFSDLPSDNTDVNGLVYYTFMALGGPCTIPISPYQEVASGSDNEKFNGDYGGGGPGTIETYAPNLTLSKTGPASATEGGASFTYTIPFQNTGLTSMGFALSTGFNAGFVISDTIPTGLQYVGGSATSTPPGGNSFIIYYSTNSGITWTTTDPGTVTSTSPDNLVMIQWWLNNPLAAGASGNVSFQARIPSGYILGGGAIFVENCGDARLGTGAPMKEACATTMVSGNNSIGDKVWSDDGTGSGGVANNALQDGTEAGINVITVNLYWDKDGDGILDTNEPLVSTATTNASGTYGFTNLPDGNYLVIVDSIDSDLPTGYGPTTPKKYAVALDPTGVSGTPVNNATSDFGFGPTLVVEKRLTTNTPAYGGESVTFAIDLKNTLPGNGTASGFCKYTIYPTIVNVDSSGNPPGGNSSNAQWLSPSNALNAPNNLYAATSMNDNSDLLGLSGFNMGNQGGAITGVQIVANVKESINLKATDSFFIRVWYTVGGVGAGSAIGTYQYFGDGTGSGSYFSAAGGSTFTISENIFSLRSWTWADFASNVTEMQVEGNKGGGAGSSGDITLDAVAYVVTTNQICSDADSIISYLPLTDSYDADLLQYTSAEPPASTATTSGSPPNTIGTITWNNLGPLYPGGTTTIFITFKALTPATTETSTTNTASVTGALFANGRSVNNDSDSADVTLNIPGSIAGTIWADTNGSGWSGTTGWNAGDSFIPNVTVNLYGCVSNSNALMVSVPPPAPNQPCTGATNNGQWVLLATTPTNSSGNYAFTGLRDGFYNVIVTESTLPAGYNQAASRRAETSTTGNGTGITCGTCDGQWNTIPADLNTFNSVDNTAGADNVTSVSFGYQDDADNQGAVVGYIWNDRDGDGVWDSNEEPISNVTVFLCASTGTCNSTTNLGTINTTNTGFYSFGNLTPGSFRTGVDITDLPSMTQTGDPDQPGIPCTTCDSLTTTAFALAANQVQGAFNFGYNGGLTIGDTVYADWNGDGNQDSGEEGINGVTVYLYRDIDGDGVVDSGTDTLLTTTTANSSGNYTFTNLAGNGNKYIVLLVESTTPTGYLQTGDPDEASTCVACDAKSGVTLNTTNVNTADFGYKPTGTGSIGDYVWNDLEGDGNQDSTETGVSGVTVNLYQDQNGDGVIDTANDALVATTTTSASGLYSFPNLAAGNYIVEIAQSNFNSGQPLSGMTLTSTGAVYTNTTTQVSYKVALTAGQTFTTADFGFAEGIIGDYIWRDDDGDGEPDTGEPGISGVTVSLYYDNDSNGVFSAGDTLVGTDVTDGSGLYEFGSLPAGDFVVVVTPPANHILTGDPDAYSTNMTASPYPPCSTTDTNYVFCDHQYGVNLLAGQVDRTADFGYKPQGVIGDTLWVDGDNDGVRDTGEAGIPYITVKLCSALPCTGGNILATTTTDSSGNYSFGGLGDGTYFVQVDSADADWPIGLPTVPTFDPDGTLDGTANSIAISGGIVISINSLPCSNCDLTIDFGYRYTGTNTVTGTIWHDDDGGGATNGIGDIDGSETYRYSGVVVYLWNCASGTCTDGDEVLAGTTTTNGTGQYTFFSMANGTYAVTINPNAAPLSGIAATTPTGYISPGSPNVVLTGNETEQRDFGFLSALDYGDLPPNYNNTLSVDNGARHSLGTVLLGASADSDPDGQESGTAAGDTDDGVFRSGNWADGANGAGVNVTVTCPSAPCYLSAWIDWDNDDDFNDTVNGVSEHIFLDQTVTNGANALTFDVPAGTFTGLGGNLTFNIRYRVYAASTGGFAQPTGFAVNGEVEDYQWLFTPTAITLRSLETRPGSSLMLVWGIIALLLCLAALGVFVKNRKSVHRRNVDLRH